MKKSQHYVAHFKESGVNKDFHYTTNFLGIPKGDDDNLEQLDRIEEDTEAQNDDVNQKLENVLHDMEKKLYVKQYEEFDTNLIITI